MKKLLLVLLTIFSCLVVKSQIAENSKWHLAGQALDFNDGTQPPTLINANPDPTINGTASMSCESGELLFYVGNRRLYNKDHIDITGTESLEIGTDHIFLPIPDETDKYYLIGTSNYSIIDASINCGEGGFVNGKKNIPLISLGFDRRIVSFIHPIDNIPYFIKIGPNPNTGIRNTFYIYKVENDNEPTLVSNNQTFNLPEAVNISEPDFKINNNLTQVVLSHDLNGIQEDFRYFDIQYTAGNVSIDTNNMYTIPWNINIPDPTLTIESLVGEFVEFSSSGRYIYIVVAYELRSQVTGIRTGGDLLLQFDTLNPNGSLGLIYNTADSQVDQISIADMQRAINQKIYISYEISSNQEFLGVINDPNENTSNTNFIENHISITKIPSLHPILSRKVVTANYLLCTNLSEWPVYSENTQDPYISDVYNNQIVADNQGNIYSVGYWNPQYDVINHDVLTKFNDCGSQIWSRDMGSTKEITTDIENNIFTLNATENPYHTAIISKITSDNDLIWQLKSSSNLFRFFNQSFSTSKTTSFSILSIPISPNTSGFIDFENSQSGLTYSFSVSNIPDKQNLLLGIDTNGAMSLIDVIVNPLDIQVEWKANDEFIVYAHFENSIHLNTSNTTINEINNDTNLASILYKNSVFQNSEILTSYVYPYSYYDILRIVDAIHKNDGGYYIINWNTSTITELDFNLNTINNYDFGSVSSQNGNFYFNKNYALDKFTDDLFLATAVGDHPFLLRVRNGQISSAEIHQNLSDYGVISDVFDITSNNDHLYIGSAYYSPFQNIPLSNNKMLPQSNFIENCILRADFNLNLKAIEEIANEPILSRKTIKENKFNIGPNPFQNVIKIEPAENEDAYAFELFGFNGNILKSGNKKTSIDSHQIDTASIPKGIYFLRIVNQHTQEIEVHKVIKK